MKSLAQILMMMALVFGAASCSDEKDEPELYVREQQNNVIR